MPNTVVIHITNEDPIVGELDELPSASDTIIIVNSPGVAMARMFNTYPMM